MTAAILLGYNMKFFIYWGTGQIFVGRSFPSRWGMNMSSNSRGLPIISLIGKTLLAEI